MAPPPALSTTGPTFWCLNSSSVAMMAVLITAELATLAGARGQGCWSGAEAQQLRPPITGQVFPAKNTSLPAATHTPTPLHPGKGTAGLVLACHPPWWRIDIYQIYATTQAGGSETLPASCRPVLCLVAQSCLTLQPHGQ